MIKRMAGQIIVIVVLCCAPGIATAQEPQPIYDGGAMYEAWSADSAQLVFYDAANAPVIEPFVNLSSESWIAYDVETGLSAASDRWPLQPELSPEERELFISDLPLEPFIFASPDARFLVFARTVSLQTGLSTVALADREAGAVIDLPLPVSSADSFDALRVWWSDDSSQVVVQTISDFGAPLILHAAQYDGSLDEGSFTPFDLQMDERVFLPISAPFEGVLDLSPDGACVLVKSTEENDERPIRLIVWCPADEAQTRILDDLDAAPILAGAFAPEGDEPAENRPLLLVTLDGLIELDPERGQAVTLLPEINTAQVLTVSFSPDGRWLTYVGMDDDTYLIDVHALR